MDTLVQDQQGRRQGGGDSLFAKKKKNCPFKESRIQSIDYKDIDLLRQFVTERGKILPRRITGVSHHFQGLLRQAVKRARHMALLPFAGGD